MEGLEILTKDNEDLTKYVASVLKIMQLKGEKHVAVGNSDFEKAAVLGDQERKLIEQLPSDERMEEMVARYGIELF